VAEKKGVGAAIAVETGRVQGLESSIHDLTLRDGSGVTALVGGSIVGTPMLTRSTEGSSLIELQIYDPELRWLEASLASQTWDCELDGLWFRYVGTTKSGAMMTLKFEDREIALLRESLGPLKRYAHRGQPNELTLAEFICGLVEEVLPRAPIVCPQLEEQQPIKTERQAKKAAKEAGAKRGKGVGDTKGLKVKGQTPTAHQTEVLETALRIAASEPCPFVCKVAVVAALIDETDAGAVDGGNVLEALEPYTRIRPTAEEISGFLFGEPEWTGVTAVGYHKAHPEATFYEIAQAVQKSGAGESTNGAGNYGLFGDEARAWVEAFDGGPGESSGSVEHTKPRSFEVKAKGGERGGPEDFWAAIQRYAKAVNWRAFFCAGVFYYISEDELARGAVRLAIRREPGHRTPVNDAIEDVDFDANSRKPVSECTVTALTAASSEGRGWGVPPGAVATVAGYGPASLGPGDPPAKEKQKEAISSAVKASTHEGKGRYIAAKIAVPLLGHPAARKVQVTLRKATRPLPEAANETKTVANPTGSRSLAGEGENGMGVYSGTAEDVVNEVIDYAHGHGFPAVTRQSVREANAAHGPTVDGNRSDHQGPPATAWAADISNGYETPEEAALAAAIAKAFGIPWSGAGLVTHEAHGYRLQLIHNTMEGGNHYDHVHFGCEVM